MNAEIQASAFQEVTVPAHNSGRSSFCRERFGLVVHHQRQLTQLLLWQRRRKERGEPVIEVEDILVLHKGPGREEGGHRYA